MGRVFVSEATGAAIYVFADDHCPPHVHVRHRGEEWVARVTFSYIDRTVELISIAPLKNAPLQRVVNALLDDIQARLADCRRSWWTTRQTTCLTNQWAVVPVAEKIELRLERTPNAKQIADATYDPASGRLYVTFRDGTTAEVSNQR
jgi:hypothetical protein